MISEVHIQNRYIAYQRPFIYCIFVKCEESYVYIGQTYDNNGVLGRLSSHLKEGGTLSKRLLDYKVTDYNNINVFVCDLSEVSIFSDMFNRKRTALEYLIQVKLKVVGCNERIPFKVVSNVKNGGNEHTFDPVIISYAETIVADLSEIILKQN